MSRKVEWPLIWTLRSQASCMAQNVREKRGKREGNGGGGKSRQEVYIWVLVKSRKRWFW